MAPFPPALARPGHRGGPAERGVALPTPLAALSVAVIAVAGVVFVATNHATPPAHTARPVTATTQDSQHPQGAGDLGASPAPAKQPASTLTAKPTKRAHHRHRHTVKRGQVYVEVYNNSGIAGLAGSTAHRASGAGWQIVGADNWYGTIAASTVYYPADLKPAARLLARDLGIHRLRPAVDPMRFDRLTVILTADYS